MNRRSCRFEIKAVNDDGTFEGYASIFGTPDGGKDIVERGAFKRTLAHWEAKGKPIPVCNQHDIHDCIGGIDSATEDPRGLFVKGRLLLDIQSARDAYTRMKAGLMTGLSFGYDAVQKEFKAGLRHLKEIKLFEVSPVLFGMHEDAGVTFVKAGDAPGDGSKPYGDETYADPGYQEDGKKRYPLTLNGEPNEKRIRAAWNYINKPANAKLYDDADLTKVRNKIIAAWKKTIDKGGPPSAEDSGKAAVAADAVLALLTLPACKIVMSDYIAEQEVADEQQQSWWQLSAAFSQSVQATLEDDDLEPDQKVADITDSLGEFTAAALAWVRAAVASEAQSDAGDGTQPSGMMGGKQPDEAKEGRVLSEANKKKVQAAIAALQALLDAAGKSAPGPAGSQAQDADAWTLSAKEQAPVELVAQLEQLQRGTN